MLEKSKLSSLKKLTTIVADTGDIDMIKQYKHQDATTNPSLIYKAAQKSEYRHLLREAVDFAHASGAHGRAFMDQVIVKLFVIFGTEILKIIPGRVSTEVDARLSFDVEGSIRRAHEYIKLYEEAGIRKERILIKLASTWEGMMAAQVLEREGIHCNMTLMFHIAQAAKAAEVGATLVSPFVGRILDWQKKKENRDKIPADEDLGVKSVSDIYHYLKLYGKNTQVMGASFRNVDEILYLAGCDLLTISPEFLKELQEAKGTVERRLSPENAQNARLQELRLDEKSFRYVICESEMATEKLHEGIRNFIADTVKLEGYLEANFIDGAAGHRKAM